MKTRIINVDTNEIIREQDSYYGFNMTMLGDKTYTFVGGQKYEFVSWTTDGIANYWEMRLKPVYDQGD